MILKRNVKLEDLPYQIAGKDSHKPLLDILFGIMIGFAMALIIFIFGLAFISYLIK